MDFQKKKREKWYCGEIGKQKKTFLRPRDEFGSKKSIPCSSPSISQNPHSSVHSCSWTVKISSCFLSWKSREMARNFKKHEENTRKYAAQIDDIYCAKSICYFKRIELSKLLQNPIKHIPFDRADQIKGPSSSRTIHQNYKNKISY